MIYKKTDVNPYIFFLPLSEIRKAILGICFRSCVSLRNSNSETMGKSFSLFKLQCFDQQKDFQVVILQSFCE